MSPARHLPVNLRLFFSSILYLVACFVLAKQATAAPQNCALNSDCVVGEFLYDDTYVPIATASCTLNTKNPDGTDLLTNQSLSPTADAFYSHTFSSLTEGYYRSNLCCTFQGDNMCIDKSFSISTNGVNTSEVASAVWSATLSAFVSPGSAGEQLSQTSTLTSQDVSNAVWNATASNHVTPGSFGERVQTTSTLTANDIWSYTNRSLTNFGSLAGDIWNYSTRSLTSFGDLIANIWSNDERTLSNQDGFIGEIWESENRTLTTSLVTTAQIEELKTLITTNASAINYSDPDILTKIYALVSENRDFLDLLVNAPIIETLIEEGETPDLQTKLDTTKTNVTGLYAGVNQITSRLNLMLASPKPDPLDTSADIKAILELIGDPSAPANQTYLSHLQWLNTAWATDNLEAISLHSTTLHESLQKARRAAEASTSSTDPALLSNLSNASSTLTTLTQSIGDPSDSSLEPTLFGFVQKTTSQAQALETNTKNVDALLSSWSTQSPASLETQVDRLKRDVLKVNFLDNATDIIASLDSKPDVRLKNQALSLKGVTQINYALLAKPAGVPVRGVFLQEGSVIFRVIVTNPSKRLSQKVSLKYSLPKELKETDILKVDEGLAITYDPTADSLVLEGEITLPAAKSSVYTVYVNDIWHVDSTKLEVIKTETNSLIDAIRKSSFFEEAVKLKSEIEIGVETIKMKLDPNATPERRIRIFREAQIELAGVNAKMDALKELARSAGNSSSLFGFVGGVQALSVWGIIFIIIVGFVFLSIYMKILRDQALQGIPINHQTAATSALTLPLTIPWITDRKPKPGQKRTPAWKTKQSKMRHAPAPTHAHTPRFFQFLVLILSSTILTILIYTSFLAGKSITASKEIETTQGSVAGSTTE